MRSTKYICSILFISNISGFVLHNLILNDLLSLRNNFFQQQIALILFILLLVLVIRHELSQVGVISIDKFGHVCGVFDMPFFDVHDLLVVFIAMVGFLVIYYVVLRIYVDLFQVGSYLL